MAPYLFNLELVKQKALTNTDRQIAEHTFYSLQKDLQLAKEVGSEELDEEERFYRTQLLREIREVGQRCGRATVREDGSWYDPGLQDFVGSYREWLAAWKAKDPDRNILRELQLKNEYRGEEAEEMPLDEFILKLQETQAAQEAEEGTEEPDLDNEVYTLDQRREVTDGIKGVELE
jgi:hypothetical protein